MEPPMPLNSPRDLVRRTASFFAPDAAGSLGSQTPPLSPGCRDRMMVLSGLRVRVGMHTGVRDTEIQYNQASARYTFGGESMSLTKAVCDAAQGGMVLMDGDTFARGLPEGWSHPASPFVVVKMGTHQLSDKYGRIMLYQGLLNMLLPRLVLLSLRTQKQVGTVCRSQVLVPSADPSGSGCCSIKAALLAPGFGPGGRSIVY